MMTLLMRWTPSVYLGDEIDTGGGCEKRSTVLHVSGCWAPVCNDFARSQRNDQQQRVGSDSLARKLRILGPSLTCCKVDDSGGMDKCNKTTRG